MTASTHPRDVRCPTCGAEPGQLCRDGAHTLPWRANHDARVRAARDLDDGQAGEGSADG